MTREQKIAAIDKPRRNVFKAIQWVLIVLLFIFLLLFFGVPLFLSSSGGTGFLLGHINNSVDGQVRMDDFSIGWLKGVRLTNLSYADSVGSTSVTVERIETQPKYLSLLRGKVKLGKTVVEQPRIYVKVPTEQKSPTEAPKAQTPPATSPTKTPAKSDAPPPIFPIHQIDLELINGSATIELTGDMPQKVSFANIASRVQIADAGKPSSIDLSMDIDETSNVSLKGAATPSKKGWTLEDADFNVQISKLQLASLKPLFALAGQEMDISGEVNADVMVKIGGGTIEQLKANAVITDLAQGVGEQRIVFDQPVTVTAAVAGSGQDIHIETFNIQSQFCNVDCDGTAESLNYAVDADLARTQRVVGQFADMGDVSMAGDLSAQGTVGLTDEKITFSCMGDLKQFQVQKGSVKTAAMDLQLDCEGLLDEAQNQLRLDHANLTATPGTVKISDVILPMSAEADKTLSLNAHLQMDLAKAWPFAQVFAGDLEDMDVSGLIDTAVDISTTGNQIRLLTKQSTIDTLKIMLPDSEPFVQDRVVLDADILMDTEQQTIDIQALKIQGTQGQTLIHVTKGSVKKKTSNTQTQLTGDFEAAYDWQAISSFASVYLPDGLQVRGNNESSFQFDSHYPTDDPDQMLANLNAASSIGFDSAEYFGLNFGPTKFNFSIQKGIVNFDIPETTVNEGILQFAGTLDLNQKARLMKLAKPMAILDKVHINDTMTRLLLLYTNPMFVDASEASGIASFSCQQMVIPLSDEDEDLLAMDGAFQVDSLKMRAGSFAKQVLALFKASDTVMMTLHPTEFVLRDGFLSYQNMQIDVEDNPLNFRGRIGLDHSLSMDVTLPWTQEFDNVKTGQPSADRITVPIEGSLDQPQIDTGKFIEQQGRQLIENELKKQLEHLFD
jgi:molybdopterin-binding protein